MDEVVAGLHRRELESARLLRFLLITTGPICEVAGSSGWGEHWVELADKCDRAVEELST